MDLSERIDDRRRRLICGAGAVTIAPIPFPLKAQGVKTLKLVVPLPPGSGVDTMARISAHQIGQLTSEPVIVENKPGASGIIAARAVLSAPLDGQTVMFTGMASQTGNAVIYKTLPYDPINDFTALKLFGGGYLGVIVPGDSPYRTLGDLIADAKRRPGALNYASGSSIYELFAEWFNQQAKIKTTKVPFKGTADAVNGTAAHSADFAIVDISSTVELVKSGRLRALAYTGPTRYPSLPDLPTITEAGLKDYDPMVWVAAVAPANTPAAALQRLRGLFAQVHASREMQDFYARNGTVQSILEPDQVRKHLVDEIARLKKVAVAAGMEPQ